MFCKILEGITGASLDNKRKHHAGAELCQTQFMPKFTINLPNNHPTDLQGDHRKV